ncbi:MAG: hypothetical protein ACXW25_05050, partial [Rhodospirillales bacterium]
LRARGPSVMAALAMIVLMIVAIGCTSGCAELYKGPRVVHYTDTSFYVRHIPPVNGARTADEIAADTCSSRNARAVLRDAYQDVPLDIRYATYECI